MAYNNVLGIEGDLPPQLQLYGMICGKWVSQAIFAAAELGIPDQLSDEARPADEVAQAVGAQAGATYRLMRALGSLGVLEEHDNRCFSLTDIGQFLRSDDDASMRPYARFIGYESNWRAWEVLDETVRTGKSGYEIVYGMNLFEYLSNHPEAAKIFNEAMVTTNHTAASQVANAYDFSEIETLADVGGGQGALLAALLDDNPGMRGIIYDMDHVAEAAHQLLAERGLGQRCEFVNGDFFKEVPQANGCILKYIIHDWDDERAICILRNCVDAIPANGKVLVVERIVPPPGKSDASKLVDIEMLALPGGIERTVDEFQALFEEAGLQLTQVLPTEGFYSIIEGAPAS